MFLLSFKGSIRVYTFLNALCNKCEVATVAPTLANFISCLSIVTGASVRLRSNLGIILLKLHFFLICLTVCSLNKCFSMGVFLNTFLTPFGMVLGIALNVMKAIAACASIPLLLFLIKDDSHVFLSFGSLSSSVLRLRIKLFS